MTAPHSTGSNPDEVVGHLTKRDDAGQLYHEPLTRADADKIMALCDEQQAARAARYPTAEDAVRGMCDAFHRLQGLGWKEAIYAPPDGRLKRIVEVGSSGIHEGYCEQPERDVQKRWWVPSPGDLWPSKPVLYFPDDEERERFREMVEKFHAEQQEKVGPT